ncbi:TorF family putative porin [Pseudomonas sp. 6D_7.1_Bac1]|uniref:TorF family putative porin n=1 Tax=Pseudomonas sp. 6D_7.1_Bac1 TaxID=2971615 RepID=UPI0021C874E0|nr:TorF family putative porin [Pseudomonas sp. 6D_7.1_Bac1]MCU1752732.1 TorF family putative porin [Pseudomonas sp. 6D_7.1_Bac1]
MKALSVFTLASLVLVPLTTQALTLNDDFSLQISLAAVSDYRTRGISQTLGDPAAQAGATLIHSSGLYVGAWTSSVDFGGDFKTRQELDYYAGYNWQATDAVSLDLGYIKYSYPKESQFNLSETYAILDAYGVQLGAYYSNDTPNVFGENQATLYTYLGYNTTLPAEVGLKLRYGRNDVKDPAFVSPNGNSRESYHEWEAKLTRDFVGVTWGLSYIDTDLSKSECTGWYGYGDLCTATVVVSASKTF